MGLELWIHREIAAVALPLPCRQLFILQIDSVNSDHEVPWFGTSVNSKKVFSVEMKRYQKVEKARAETPIDENEIRIRSQGRMCSYITYAMSLLQYFVGKKIFRNRTQDNGSSHQQNC